MKLVEEHAEWFVGLMQRIMPRFQINVEYDVEVIAVADIWTIMREVFGDSMEHGYKHGFEDANEGHFPDSIQVHPNHICRVKGCKFWPSSTTNKE